MKTKRETTAERILKTGRRLFNAQGYAATTLTEIADEVGISQGNLTYHFPTKRDLAARLVEDLRREVEKRRAGLTPGPVVDDYVEHLLHAMTLVWRNRFIFRDKSQLETVVSVSKHNPDIAADFDELRALLARMDEAGMLRRDLPVDLTVLTRALWVVSRYWMEHVLEFEGRDTAAWDDQKRGLEHHFAVLSPYLTAAARRQLQDALRNASLKRTAVAPLA